MIQCSLRTDRQLAKHSAATTFAETDPCAARTATANRVHVPGLAVYPIWFVPLLSLCHMEFIKIRGLYLIWELHRGPFCHGNLRTLCWVGGVVSFTGKIICIEDDIVSIVIDDLAYLPFAQNE
jgi:hypothetical protein